MRPLPGTVVAHSVDDIKNGCPMQDALPERRNVVTRQGLLNRISVEYAEMPGLSLTVAQAQRFFALREDICTRVLDRLTDTAYLRRVANGAYVRNDERP